MSAKKKSIPEILPNVNPELMSIMMQMLEINPYFRPTARQLLKNKIFDSVRIKENEVCANHQILINADKFE